MRNLKLNLESLEVETFATTDAAAERGTVLGRESAVETYYAGETCQTVCHCGGTGYSVQGPSCAYEVETCYDPCEFSYITNCHRCQFYSEQTRCVNC